jgi:small-conductance mechanosensitive channel
MLLRRLGRAAPFGWIGLAVALALCWPGTGRAQPPQPPGSQLTDRLPAGAALAQPTSETATLVFFNRPIVSLRARVLERSPGERAAAAREALDELVARRITGPVEMTTLEGGVLITVGQRGVIVLTTPDLEPLAGETVDDVGRRTVARLEQALGEAGESRALPALLRGLAVSILALSATWGLLWVIGRAHRVIVGALIRVSERTVARSGIADVAMLRASRLLDFQRGLATTIFVGLRLVVAYVGMTFVLRQFPFTRPWGESMSGILLASIRDLALGIVDALPGLFTVLLILVMTRFAVRLVRFWFDAVERGRVRARWIYPETAQPTRRILTTLLWLFAIVVAYPYLPGSDTDAFRGVSVFLGLMLTFGSSGLMNQIMSGFMIVYSRALRLGDFVRIGDVEGTVSHLGVLSTKIRTPYCEEVTVPNAVVISQTTTDYSRLGDTEGTFTPASVTIGYDTPWRQVQQLLLMAAERTTGLRREPKPMVLQEALQDFYVKYTLLVSLENQATRPFTLHALHANIQDLFNEYGVQIMSPNYVFDPSAPKVVARNAWFAAPARPDPPHDD